MSTIKVMRQILRPVRRRPYAKVLNSTLGFKKSSIVVRTPPLTAQGGPYAHMGMRYGKVRRKQGRWQYGFKIMKPPKRDEQGRPGIDEARRAEERVLRKRRKPWRLEIDRDNPIKRQLSEVEQNIKNWVHPKHRIPHWNIYQGAKVRLLRGEKSDKFVDAEKGRASGWKIHQVEKVDQKRNIVHLKGISTNAKDVSHLTRHLGDSDEAKIRKQEFEFANRGVPIPFHYSSLGLLIEEHKDDPTMHIWAKRVRRTPPKWDKQTGKWRWRQTLIGYNPAFSGRKAYMRKVVKFPKRDEQPKQHSAAPPAFSDEAERSVALEKSYSVLDLEDVRAAQDATGDEEALMPEWMTYVDDLMPTTLRSAPPTDTRIPDLYSQFYHSKMDSMVADNLMPLFLGEELSPRLSRRRTQLLWQQRQQVIASQRQEAINRAVEDWELMGRDTDLREIMDSSLADLRGVPLRPRSKAEVVEAAGLEFDTEREEEVKQLVKNMKFGYRYDREKGQWLSTPKSDAKERKLRMKERKRRRQERSLVNLRLPRGKNQVLPSQVDKVLTA